MATKAMKYENAIDWFKTYWRNSFYYPNTSMHRYVFDMLYEFHSIYGDERVKMARLAAKEARRWAEQELPKANDAHLFGADSSELRLLPYNEEFSTLIEIINVPKE